MLEVLWILTQPTVEDNNQSTFYNFTLRPYNEPWGWAELQEIFYEITILSPTYNFHDAKNAS